MASQTHRDVVGGYVLKSLIRLEPILTGYDNNTE
jgi:hypothetical protein